jgi:RimJ/RimL family protein N-acetyltransferase
MLEGTRIALRPLEESDLPMVTRWRNRKDIRRYFFDKSLLSLSGQKAWFESYLTHSDRKIFIAVLLETGEPVGMIGLYRIDVNNRKAEIGSTIVGDPRLWGKGIAREMIRLLLDHAFTDLNLNRIYAYAMTHNQGSIRSKLKCGFLQEGLLRQDHYMDGRFVDVLLFGITRQDWESQQNYAHADDGGNI